MIFFIPRQFHEKIKVISVFFIVTYTRIMCRERMICQVGKITSITKLLKIEAYIFGGRMRCGGFAGIPGIGKKNE